jgi:hypothetical protein
MRWFVVAASALCACTSKHEPPPPEPEKPPEPPPPRKKDFKGTVTIDAFDNKHIAGTIKINAKQGVSKKRVTIEGTFDFACPGMAGCAK